MSQDEPRRSWVIEAAQTHSCQMGEGVHEALAELEMELDQTNKGEK